MMLVGKSFSVYTSLSLNQIKSNVTTVNNSCFLSYLRSLASS